jgi:hypothetical protein
MPWAPELFSARLLARLEERRQHKLVDVPLWDGLMTGELDTLIGSFAGQREVHHPCTRSHPGRAGVRGVCHRTERVVRAAPRLGRGGRWRRCAATRI